MIISALSAVLAASAFAADAPATLRARADAHFLAGYDHYRSGRPDDARREWKACREIDETHDFCEFGLSVLDAGAPKAADAEPEAPVTAAPPKPDRGLESRQRYLEGVIYYQKGDYEQARSVWTLAKELAPPGSDAAKDAAAGIARVDKLYEKVPATGDGAPKTLKTAPEKKDEYAAMQTYYSGLIHYQNGDLATAQEEWTRAVGMAPPGSQVAADAKAALAKIKQEEDSTYGDRKK